jgi:hypothetical protein
MLKKSKKLNKNNMNNYHYTKAIHLANIINEGEIRTTLVTGDKKERPAVWLTKSEEWEVCASPGSTDPITGINTLMTLQEMKESVGVCRIKISEMLPTTSWAKFKYDGKISETVHQHLTEYSNKVGGKTHLWNCSFSPIRKKHFESVEMLVGDEWVKWEGHEPIEEFVDNCHKINSIDDVPLYDSKLSEAFQQMQFYWDNEIELIEAWEQNKGKKGYLEVIVLEDYSECHINFIEGRFNKKAFLNLKPSSSGEYMYLHLLWSASKTHYKAAFAYNSNEKRIELFMGSYAA